MQRGPKSTSIRRGGTSTSLVRWEKGRVTNPALKNLLKMNIYPDCTPPTPCAENFSRGSSFFRCPAQNVIPSPCLMKIDLISQAAEAHERLFVSAGGKSHSCVDLSVLRMDSLPD